VKLLQATIAGSATLMSAVQSRVQQLADLQHPNILRIHGLHRGESQVWIALQYAAGGDLGQFRGRGYLQFLPLVLQAARGLAAAHDQGCVHADLKPQNVLLTGHGDALLADFKLMAARPGSAYGMSPQQFAGSPATAGDDIYSFGALLFELLSGYPPHYPNLIESEPPSNIIERPGSKASRPAGPATVEGTLPITDGGCGLFTQHAAPTALQELTRRCLARAPDDRPCSMHNVVQELERIMTQTSDAASPGHSSATPTSREPVALTPPARSEALQAAWKRPTSSGSAEAGSRLGFRRGITVAAIGVMIALIAVAFLLLPGWVAQHRQVSAPVAARASAPPASVPAAAVPEVDYKQLALLKQQAEDHRTALDARIGKLEERAAALWAQAPMDQARSASKKGDAEFAARDYAAANREFDLAAAELSAVEKQAPAALKQALHDATEALNNGRSTDAQRAFELALKLDPRNAQATAGLKRAQSLDEVIALLAQASEAEKSQQNVQAEQFYAQARRLDPQYSAATEGAARMRARISADAFATAMARGFGSLAAKNYAAARLAFGEAARIRPGTAEIESALRQVEQEERTQTIAATLENARAAERAERWKDALDDYRAILKLDSTIATAQEGEQRTEPRAVLNDQLELYLSQPERLFSSAVQSAARSALDQARAISDPGPVLGRQMTTLTQWLASAQAPVPVALESDNLTRVTIYRVGDLGSFERHTLELVPGTYTVIGSRPGYRDVRRELVVHPGQTAEVLVIRCEERI
jgi:tetratricopeptide (TPR) repeat protein